MISPEQREARKKYLGGSDAAAVMGMDKYRSAADVWLEKTGRVEAFLGNEATERGTFLEPAIVAWAESELGVRLRRDVMLIDPGAGLLAANLDALVDVPADGRLEIVEAKSTVLDEDWGEKGTDDIPHRVLVQVLHQFAVCDRARELDPYRRIVRVAWVPVLLPGYRSFDFRMYRIERDDDLIAHVADTGEKFMRECVQADCPPSGSRCSLDVLKRMKREPGKVVTVADELVDAWIVAKAAAKQAREDLEQQQAALLQAMGDADGADCTQGLITYLEVRRAGFTVAPTAFRMLKGPKPVNAKTAKKLAGAA